MNEKKTLYGVEEEKKFPLDTKAHVISAVKFFNYVSPKYEEELASKLIKKVKEHNIKLTPTNKNRFYNYYNPDEYIEHFGLKGMKWGVRKYQNPDGSYTAAGKARYGIGDGESYHRISKGSSKSSNRSYSQSELADMYFGKGSKLSNMTKQYNSNLAEAGLRPRSSFNKANQSQRVSKTSNNNSQNVSSQKKGLSTKQKVAIGVGVGVAATVGGVALYKHVKNVKLHKIERQNAQAQYFIDSLSKQQASHTYVQKDKVLKTISSGKAKNTSGLQKAQERLNIHSKFGKVDVDPNASSTKELLNKYSGFTSRHNRVSGKAERQAARNTMKSIRAENKAAANAVKTAKKAERQAARNTMKSIKAENKAAQKAYNAAQVEAKKAAKDKAWYTKRTGYNAESLRKANEAISRMANKSFSEVKNNTAAEDFTKELLKSQADIDKYFLG